MIYIFRGEKRDKRRDWKRRS